MRRVSSISSGITLLFLIISICSVVFIIPDSALAQPPICAVTILKEAEGTEGIDFDFLFEVGANESPFILTSAIPREDFLQTTVTATYTELDNPGWVLADVSCESNDGVTVAFVENGVTIECLDAGGEVGCVWTNVRASKNIPTLSEWGMIAAAGGLMIVGVWFAVRRKKAQIV